MGVDERFSDLLGRNVEGEVLIDGERLKHSDIYLLLRKRYSMEEIEQQLPYDAFVGAGLRDQFPEEPFIDKGEMLFRGSASEHLFRGITRAATEVTREQNPELFDARRAFLHTRSEGILTAGAKEPLEFTTDRKGFETLRIHPLPSLHFLGAGTVLLDDGTSTDTEGYIHNWLPQRLLCELLAHPTLGSAAGRRILHLLRGSDRQHGYVEQGAVINVLWAMANLAFEPDRTTSDVWNTAGERRVAFAEFFSCLRLVEEVIPGSSSVAGFLGKIDSKTFKAFFREVKNRTY